MILAVQAPACSAPGHVAHTAIPCLRVRPASGAQQCLVQFSMKYALTSRLPAQSACGRRLPSEPCQAAAQARRLRAISSQVAQPSGDLCVSQSDSQSDSAIDDRVAVKSGGGAAQATCSSAGPVPAAGASEDVRHPGRVGVVDFNGPAGRPGKFALAFEDNRARHRRRRLAQVRARMDEAQMMEPILVGRRRRMFWNVMGDSQDQASSSGTLAASPSSGKERNQDPSHSLVTTATSAGTKPAGAVGNVVTHNLDFSSTTRVMSPGFAVRCPSGVVLPILPNLMAVNGPLGIKEMEEMVSQRVLSSVLTLELPKELCSVSLTGETEMFKQSIQYKAAALQRIITRARQRHRPDFVILVQCRNPTLQPVAQLVAAWLHWSCHMGVQESCDRAGAACGCHVPRALIDKANEDLYQSAVMRAKKCFLVWRYGGFNAKVAGEVVGSWGFPRSMVKVTKADYELYGLRDGDWVLKLPDLAPGTYRYKYVIDDSWRMDWCQPCDDDDHFNSNNIWEVAQNQPLACAVPECCMHVVRKEFMSTALRVKLRLGPKLLSK